MKKLLIANRGEIAVRVIRTARDMGLETAAVYSTDDSWSLHVRLADEAVDVGESGPRAYLNADSLIAVAVSVNADAIHPGYGFVSENPKFAAAVEQADLVFVGPTSETLAVCGDKPRARALAVECSIPVSAGVDAGCDLNQAIRFLDSLPDGRRVIIKAAVGGGGRGMRVASTGDELREAWSIGQAEAKQAFGDGALYVEEYLTDCRHIEIQVAGDGTGEVVHFGDRDCTLQRRFQKLVEVAPCPALDATMRSALTDAALVLARRVKLRGVATVEFLVDGERYVFIEVNPRLQVEHTVTEEVYGIDLVQLQLEIAAGKTLSEMGYRKEQGSPSSGYAVQARVNTEMLNQAGEVRATSGTLRIFEPPSGPGVRIDTHGYAGYSIVPAFDSLLAKVIVRSKSAEYTDALKRTARALREFRIDGVETNCQFLECLLADDDVVSGDIHTDFIDQCADRLAAASATVDSLAVGSHSNELQDSSPEHVNAGGIDLKVPPGIHQQVSSMPGTVVDIAVQPGDCVRRGQTLFVIESMKMQHVVSAETGGRIQQVHVEKGETLHDRHPLIWIAPDDSLESDEQQHAEQDLTQIRSDLQEVYDRKAAGHDVNRPDAVTRRRQTGHRTARENIADLCDEGTFAEYGSVVLAAQRGRRGMDDLIANTTGDGMVCGLGQINGHLFDTAAARAMLVSYDYMVLAGTQGMMNHSKKDRVFEIAEKYRLPVVLFAEGGGGRPGDTDAPGVAGLDCRAFSLFARLSALVPLIGIVTGRCFAGNAVLLSCCDVIIATKGSNIGVGGPAMIEGGGLGVYRPEEVGPMDVQVPNGVVDIAVEDEGEAVAVAKRYLSYFQGAVDEWTAPDQRLLRFIVPENRLHYYDMRDVLHGIADVDSVLELRSHWGVGIITAFIRVEGRPVGVIANNPGHLAGAIDADGADKAARFMQLCDAFDLPILSLCDCPGIMVGPEVEKSAMVRHAGRLFVAGANIDVPLMTIITRKGYGLGVMAMAGGSFKAPLFTVTWPTGEFGGMGLEGAVKLGYRKELQAIEDPAERQATFEKMVAQMYEHGKAVNMASHFELDDVIDPAESRHWIITALNSVPPVPQRTKKKRPNVDTW